ncbi:MAG: hydrolase or metal-binding protein, partial [Bacilli bacterium]
EVNSEEGLDLVEEFYTDEIVESEQVQPETTTRTKTKPRFNQGDGVVQDIQKGLQGSVRAVI